MAGFGFQNFRDYQAQYCWVILLVKFYPIYNSYLSLKNVTLRDLIVGRVWGVGGWQVYSILQE
jgi:hypothetical protein